MTKEECLAIQGLNDKQIRTIKRHFWAANREGKPCKYESCNTPEEVISMVNKSFRVSHIEDTTTTNLENLSIEELQELLTKIPTLIEKKKAEKKAELAEQIKALQDEMKAL